jgi:ATP-grasp domain/L-amino acid ligase C-terminal domain 2/ATP-grasp N-terminal domain
MKLLALEAVQNAGYYQSRYRQIEEFGGDLYVLNGLGEPGYWTQGKYRIAGSKHIDDIVATVRDWHADQHFDGVLTFSESGVLTVAAVAEALGLPGIGLDTARTSRNKLLMRRAQQAGGAAVPLFRLVPDIDGALATAEEYGYPVILKPTLGAASNFVFRINTPDEMRARYAQALDGMQRMSWFQMEADGIDHGPYGLLVESFLDGQEMQIEALAWDNEVYLGSIVDRITVEGDTFDDDVHRAPTALGPGQLAKVHDLVTRAAHGQGLRHAVMHAEVRFHRGEPHMLEIAARPGGGGLDYFARLSADYCPIRATMAVAAGIKPDVHHYRPTGVHLAGTCLIGGPGRIEQITVPPEVAASDRVFFLKITAKPGDVVRRPPDGNNILGFLCTSGSTFDEAISTAYDFAGRIDVRLAEPAPA